MDSLTNFFCSPCLVNLAFNQTAQQSSTQGDNVASKAIDGNFQGGESYIQDLKNL